MINMPPRPHGTNPVSTAAVAGRARVPSCTWDQRALVKTGAEGSWEQSLQSTFPSTWPGEGSGFSTQTQPLAASSVQGVPGGSQQWSPSAHSAGKTPHLCRLSRLLPGHGRALSTENQRTRVPQPFSKFFLPGHAQRITAGKGRDFSPLLRTRAEPGGLVLARAGPLGTAAWSDELLPVSGPRSPHEGAGL